MTRPTAAKAASAAPQQAPVPEMIYIWVNTDGTCGASADLDAALSSGGIYCGYLCFPVSRPTEEATVA